MRQHQDQRKGDHRAHQQQHMQLHHQRVQLLAFFGDDHAQITARIAIRKIEGQGHRATVMTVRQMQIEPMGLHAKHLRQWQIGLMAGRGTRQGASGCIPDLIEIGMPCLAELRHPGFERFGIAHGGAKIGRDRTGPCAQTCVETLLQLVIEALVQQQGEQDNADRGHQRDIARQSMA